MLAQGELVTGFRVQREVYRSRHRIDGTVDEESGMHWVNIGRKCYSTDEAKAYRDFLMQYAARNNIETLEVIEVDTPVDMTEYANLRVGRR